MRLISVNVERSQHLGRILPYVREAQPDTLCVQELMEKDASAFADASGCALVRFFPSMELTAEHVGGIEGIGLFSRLAATASGVEYYVGSPDAALPRTDPGVPVNADHRAVLWADLAAEGGVCRIATTHFTWTPNGEPSDLQREHLGHLFAVLDGLGEFALCGDFNAPRGGEIFGRFAERLADNIPLSYETSIDLNLHRAGKTAAHELAYRMVDGLFTTPAYAASDVGLVFGVSDHAAIQADIRRV